MVTRLRAFPRHCGASRFNLPSFFNVQHPPPGTLQGGGRSSQQGVWEDQTSIIHHRFLKEAILIGKHLLKDEIAPLAPAPCHPNG